MKYCFYYDESEHSRVINLSTVTGETYYDGFLAAIIGWRSDHETAFEQRYHAFEEKYADRKKKGELKSGTIHRAAENHCLWSSMLIICKKHWKALLSLSSPTVTIWMTSFTGSSLVAKTFSGKHRSTQRAARI